MRRTKTVETNRARLRHVPTQRVILVWAVFLLSAAVVFLWARAENQRIVSEYQQSDNCGKSGQKDCREVLDAVVEQVSPVYGSVMPNRFGGANSQKRLVISIDLDIVASDGWKSTTRLSKGKFYQPGQDWAGGMLFYDLLRLDTVQKGDVIIVTRWNDKILTVRLPGSTVNLYTIDHPLNDWSVRFLPLRSIFFLLLIAVLIWTGYETLCKRG